MEASWRLGAVVALACGCGRIAFDPLNDAGFECAFGPWTAPVELTALSTAIDDLGPSISLDGLTLFYTKGPTADLYMATRSSTSELFANPQQLVALSSVDTDSSPTLSRDDLTLYFSSNRTGSYRLYAATRGSTSEAFGAPSLVPELANEDVLGPYITRDGAEMFFTRDFATIVTTWRATYDAATGFMIVGQLSELNGPAGFDGWPTMTPDLTTIYFEAIRGGIMKTIYMARRDAPGMPFGPVEQAPFGFPGAINADPEISRDGRTFLFGSNRNGSHDLYMMTRECL